jgi:hypothetical protein
MLTRTECWISSCKPLISNAGILSQLGKFIRDISAGGMPLNQRVPGSSPGAATKQDQALPTLANQNGPFSLKTSLRLAAISSTVLLMQVVLTMLSGLQQGGPPSLQGPESLNHIKPRQCQPCDGKTAHAP